MLVSDYVFDNDNQHFRILSFINCKSTNIIFCIYCSICGPISIYFTSKTLVHSYNDIMHTINFNPSHPLSLHFYKANHSVNNLYIQGLQKFYSHSIPYDRILIWIHRLKTFNYIDTDISIPKLIRFNLPYSTSNALLFKNIKDLIFKRFNVSISPAFSNFPNLKQILCSRKNINVIFLFHTTYSTYYLC